MSLLDALLLDPVRMDVWVAYRSTPVTLLPVVQGSGTQNDPYTVNTAADFDALMNDVGKIPVNTCVHLGPGVFLTAGYDFVTDVGWKIRSGIRMVGSGIDVTTLRLSNSTPGARLYAIGHTLAANATVDFCEISDLTIDGNFSILNGIASAGAVRVMGNHSRVVRVKVTNWGSRTGTSVPTFAIGMLTGGGTAGTNPGAVVNCGMQECIVIPPVASSTGPVTLLNLGASENPGTIPANGVGGYIRNCFVDAGQEPLSDTATMKLFRALSVSWSKMVVVEGNQIQNTFYGGPYSDFGAYDIIVRDNIYRNVATGPIWQLATTSANGVQKLLIEGNTIELTTVHVTPLSASGITNRNAMGVILYDRGTGLTPFGSAIIRNNLMRYLNGAPPNSGPVKTGSGVLVMGATSLLVRDNLLDLVSNPPPITNLTNLSNKRCVNVQYFENRSSAGALIQGFKEEDSSLYTELATDADDAFMLSLLLRE